jgi:hypothetical protein
VRVSGSMLKTFMLEETDIVYVYLRRYVSSDTPPHPDKGWSYHNAEILVGEEKAEFEIHEDNRSYPYITRTDKAYLDKYKEQFPYSHDRWPIECDWCNYQFSEDDEWQIHTELMYRRTDTGKLIGIINPPEGAMYYAWWFKNNPRYAPTGPLYAVCPGGHPWNIDGRATNCGKPDDDVHRCWIRHGEPPNITVDKQGNTCQAGGGSIQAGDYHGFLRDGYFTDSL